MEWKIYGGGGSSKGEREIARNEKVKGKIKEMKNRGKKRKNIRKNR